MSKTYKIFNEKLNSKKIYPKIINYLFKCIKKNEIEIKKKSDIKKIFISKNIAKKITNLNHNGALLPKSELEKEFFEIFYFFKKIIKKYIPKTSLIHFPIIIRMNNILANKKNNYSSSFPHFDSWAGQPELSEIISFNIISSSKSPVIQYTGKKKLSLKKRNKYKKIIKPSEYKSVYKSKKGDFIICGPGTLHRTSSGKDFRVFLECRFIESRYLKKTDEKKFTNYYYKYNEFFKINSKNTKIVTELRSIANSRFGVDIKRL